MPDSTENPETPDLALLSAYLDGALPLSERTALDQRLDAEPALRNEIDALRLTQAIIRAAPILTVPRDFTLDPARYGSGSRRQGIYPGSGRRARILSLLAIVSAVAAALIFVVLTANQGGLAPAARTVQVASNPTVVTPAILQSDALVITITLVASPKPPSTLVPVLIATSPLATTTLVAAAAAQSGASTSVQGSAGNTGQDSLASSPQPNLSAPIGPSNGVVPVAPSILILSTATPHNASVAPIIVLTNAATSAKAAPTNMPSASPAASRSVSARTDLPTVLKVILWVLLGLFGGKGLR